MKKKKKSTNALEDLANFRIEPEPTSSDPGHLRISPGHVSIDSCQAQPEFRVITLEGAGHTLDGEEVEPGVGVSLLCPQCAIHEARELLEVMDGNLECNIPTLGFMILPLHIESSLAEELRANVVPEVLTKRRKSQST